MSNKPPLLSKNLNECLTPCIPKGNIFINPVTMDGLISREFNMCAIEPILDDDNLGVKWAEECNIDDNTKFELPNVSRNLMLSFYFNPTEFLRSVYSITSLEDTIYWTTENENLPFETIKRVHNSAWLAFGQTEGLTSNVVTYYHKVINENWIGKYIDRLRKEYAFATDKNPEKLLSDILTKQFISKALKQFLKNDNWKNIYDYYSHIIWFVYDLMVNKMNLKSIE